MASLQERNGAWTARVTRKGYPQQFKTFPSKAEAAVWARAVEVAMDNGTFNDPAGSADVIFGDLLKKYKERVTTSKRSRRSEEFRINKMLRNPIAEYSMKNLTTGVLAKYRDDRLKEASNGSVCRELATICSVISHAQREWGLKTVNPVKLIKKPRLPPGRERLLKLEELDLLYGALDPSGHMWRNKLLVPLVQMAIETAMRRGELLSLVWDDVDLSERVAFLPITKNGNSRSVPLSTRAVEILSNLERTDARVLPISDYTVDCAWKRAIKRAGIKNFRFHDLRHQAITAMAKKIPNVIELAAISGHSNPKMLSRYYHTTPQELAAKLG
ncbi:site-specific integrase [Paraburkholderia graminis]